jgi:hypothetical protein
MTQLSSVTQANQSPGLPQPVAAPLASLADRPFAYVLRGLVAAQLRRGPAPDPEPGSAPALVGLPARGEAPSVIVGVHGPGTVSAFNLWHKVVPANPADN